MTRVATNCLIAICVLLPCGCVSIPRDTVPRFDEALFVDPFALHERQTNGAVNSPDKPSRSLNVSLWNLTRADRTAAWDDWGRANLQDGDIVFLQSKSNWVWGVIELSQVTQDVTDSPFTHVAMAAKENGRIVLYDIDIPGPSRTPFGKMIADSKTAAVGVKRLSPEFQSFVPDAVQYCRDAYASDLPFDKQLKLDNDRLYCAELIEVAFRASGLELSEPTRWQDLPGLEKHPYAVNTIAWANDTQPSEFVVVPGNEQIGIWSSPGLELILPLTDAKEPPRVAAPRQPR